MVTRENQVIGVSILAAVALLVALAELTRVSEVVIGASVLFVGVILPTLLNGYLDRRGS